MRVRSKVWLEDDGGEIVFGGGRLKMLELIDELGSMQAAAKALNMSYRGVWARIKATEKRLNLKLVETSLGRGKNRGSRLTPAAKALLSDFKLLTQKDIAYTDDTFASIFEGKDGGITPVTPTVAVVGLAGSGKTALIARLVAEWSRRGRRVGVIKTTEDSEGAPRFDRSPQPTEAYNLIWVAPERLVIQLPTGISLTAEIIAANYALGTDLVLVESRQRLQLPSIDLFRQERQKALLTRKSKNLLAVVGDPPEKKNCPYFQEEDTAGLVDLIEEKFLKKALKTPRADLYVDGRRVPLLPFVQEIIKNTVTGLVTSLKSCENPGDIELTIRRSGHE